MSKEAVAALYRIVKPPFVALTPRLKLLLGDSLGDEELDEVMNEVDAWRARTNYRGWQCLMFFPWC